MSQIFHPSTNTFSRVSIFGALFFIIGLGGLIYAIMLSPYVTHVGVVVPQPIQFSHQHHVQALGIDCRYCHTSVEDSNFAGIPPTHTCMTCHSQIWTNSPMLQMVRDSYQNNQPIVWNRVHDVPDYVYFNHSIHIDKGIGCSSCHGQVDRMPLVWKAQPMTMQWCLDCHRDPARYIRPKDQIFNMSYRAPENQAELGQKLVQAYHVPTNGRLTDCYTCHR